MTPAAVVKLAKASGLTALALTDHDTVAGCDEAASAALEQGIDFLCGIEISCEFPRPGTMHLLGYGVDPANPTLRDLMKKQIEGRDARNVQIIEALRNKNVAITLEEVKAEAGGGVVGRPHIAAILIRKGYVSSTHEAFAKYLGQGGSVYFDKEVMTAKRAIGMIRDAGGLAVLAHPVQLKRENDAQLLGTIKELVDHGLSGIEVIHSDHRESLIDWLSDVADRYGLVKTGGSDFHGKSKPHIKLGHAGSRRVVREMYDRLVERIAAAR